MALEERAPEAAAESEANEVAGSGGQPDQPDQRHQLDVSVGRHDAADHDRCFAWNDQAHEGAGLKKANTATAGYAQAPRVREASSSVPVKSGIGTTPVITASVAPAASAAAPKVIGLRCGVESGVAAADRIVRELSN